MGERRDRGEVNEAEPFDQPGGVEAVPALPRERRLLELMLEFRHRQRQRPDLVVRPWWSPDTAEGGVGRRGFVVEYCPNGRDSVHLLVRTDRVTVDGPGNVADVELDLEAGWVFGGLDTRSPQTLANHLIRLADRAVGEAA